MEPKKTPTEWAADGKECTGQRQAHPMGTDPGMGF